MTALIPPAKRISNPITVGNYNFRGSWFVVRGPWFVARGPWFVIRGSWLVVRAALGTIAFDYMKPM